MIAPQARALGVAAMNAGRRFTWWRPQRRRQRLHVWVRRAPLAAANDRP